ncbi:MAG: hypothetical protein ACI8Q1_003223 [Parvicella sp.]|jgi:hypothetical protein
MKKFIFLDTCNWIYLSNGFNILSNKHDELHLKLFDKIKSWVNEGRVIILINEIVQTEWERNRDQAASQIKDIENKYKSYLNSLKSIEGFIGSQPEFDKLKDDLNLEYLKRIDRHKGHIQSVVEFLKEQAQKIEILDSSKVEATNLAIQRKAPFIEKKKNSMADAIIFLSSIEHIYLNERQPIFSIEESSDDFIFPESYFVSSNKTDFSHPENKEKIHPDLAPYLDKTKTKFYFTLADLVKSLEDGYLSEEEERILEHLDESVYCDVCDFGYYPTIEFSNFFEIYDPNKEIKFVDKNQLHLGFNEEHEEHIPSPETVISEIRTADCSHCGTEFIECTCRELIQVDTYNNKISCNSCNNKYLVHADMDRKGMIHNIEYEIILEEKCERCGEEFEELSELGLCDECAEYERLSQEI